jgi:hypothetical protein
MMCIAGCGKSFRDSYPFQPFREEGSNTVGIISVAPKKGIDLAGKSQYVIQLKWKSKISNVIDSESVVNRCAEYLQKIDFKRKFTDECEYNNQYPWLSDNKHINSFREYWKETNGHDILFQELLTIINLDPIIVIISDGCIADFPCSYLYVDDESHDYKSIVLKNGFAYGTHIPYSDNLKWFSPDMDILPQPVKIGSDRKGRIRVPWGHLVLTNQDNGWIVSAEFK